MNASGHILSLTIDNSGSRRYSFLCRTPRGSTPSNTQHHKHSAHSTPSSKAYAHSSTHTLTAARTRSHSSKQRSQQQATLTAASNAHSSKQTLTAASKRSQQQATLTAASNAHSSNTRQGGPFYDAHQQPDWLGGALARPEPGKGDFGDQCHRITSQKTTLANRTRRARRHLTANHLPD